MECKKFVSRLRVDGFRAVRIESGGTETGKAGPCGAGFSPHEAGLGESHQQRKTLSSHANRFPPEPVRSAWKATSSPLLPSPIPPKTMGVSWRLLALTSPPVFQLEPSSQLIEMRANVSVLRRADEVVRRNTELDQ